MEDEQIREGLQGLSVQEFFETQWRGMGIKFSNILLSNQHLDFRKSDISLATRLTHKIKLAIPVVTSPMDTVTKARMARAIADTGGIGIIHVNLQPSQQAREVSKVKRGGLIVDPIVLDPSARLEELECVRGQYSHIPITAGRKPNGKLLGMISTGFRPRPHHETVGECMGPAVSVQNKEILYPNGTVDVPKALLIMEAQGLSALPVVDGEGYIVGLLVASDLRGAEDRTRDATLDERGRRRVGAAIITDPEDYERRVPRLVENGADVLCIDTAQGDSRFVLETIEWVKGTYPEVELIAGNVSTAEGALRLINAGADALRVGNGSGGVCTTHAVTATGAMQPAAIYRTAAIASVYDIPVIADGAIRRSGDIISALALGAHTVMVGTYVAALPESAAPLKSVVIDGRSCLRKAHRGMASAGALQERVVARYESAEEADRMPEGEEIYLEPSVVSLAKFIAREMAGVHQGFNYLGVRTIDELHERVRSGRIRFDYVPSSPR